ncbi:hypothetical protein DsansV1_C03g0026071 [Dioscorea sansibarensis]
MKPSLRLNPNSSMSSRGKSPFGRPSSSNNSMDFFLQSASPLYISAPLRYFSPTWEAIF